MMDAYEHAEDAVGTTMLSYITKRALSTLLLAALTAIAELAVVVLAVCGLFLLHGWIQITAAVYLIVNASVRPLRIRRRKRLGMPPPSRRSAILAKVAAVPVNAIGYPVFAAGLAWPVAVGSCVALLVVEFGLWFVLTGPYSDRLRQISGFMQDTDPPRTWEI